MTPEQKIASRLRSLYKVSTPVDVPKLVRMCADLEYVSDLPDGIDGLKIPAEQRTGSKERPLVLVRKDRGSGRLRFTLAHELGHLIIPWHVEAGVTYTTSQEDWQDECEAEANRFAAELLAPQAWISELWKLHSPDISSFWEAVQEAGLSIFATVLTVAKALPAGFLFYKVDFKDRVQYATRSPDTHLRLPSEDSVIQRETWSTGGLGSQCFELERGLFCVIHRSRFGEDLDSIPDLTGNSSKELFEEILLKVPLALRDGARRSANGIIGAANSGRNRPETRERLAAALEQRFQLRDGLENIVSHPKFPLFLRLKAIELRP